MPKQPNILFFMCDQMQGRVFDQGHPTITPSIDKFIARGTQFTQAYTPNAVCSPARASLMTGLLPHNHGVLWVTHNVDQDQGRLRTDKPHWAQRLKQAGYTTGYFGKWHVEKTNELEKYGWDVNGEMTLPLFSERRKKALGEHTRTPLDVKAKYYSYPEGYSENQLFYAVSSLKPENRWMGISTNLALEFIDDASSQTNPWCCFVSVPEPHDPFICSEEALQKYDIDSLPLPANLYDDSQNRPRLYQKAARTWSNFSEREHREAMACYYASITEIDEQFGRLIQKLEDTGELDNTIIIFTSDHGEMLGAHGLYCKNVSAYEEVYHIPLIMAGPGIPKGLTTDARVGLHDLCPTLLDLTGCEITDAPDSSSFKPLLEDPSLAAQYRRGYAEYHGGRILLTQRIVWNDPWKFVFNAFDFDELYNLDDDPAEMNNLSQDPQHTGRVKKMMALVWDYLKKTGDTSLYNSDYPILRVAPYGPYRDDL